MTDFDDVDLGKDKEKLDADDIEEEHTAQRVAPQPISPTRSNDVAASPKNQRENGEEEDDETQYPQSLQLALISIALCLSVFCMALDNTILSSAIPKITDQFKAIDDVGWYGSAYLLLCCAFQLFFGKLYTFLSLKWVFLSTLVIFEIGSAVCGAAPNSTTLIIGRAIAGLGSAGIFSGAVLIISNTVPLRKRPAYMGMIGGMYGIASVAGPLMGGVFTDKVTWRWCFYINLPIGAVTLLFIAIFYHPTKRAQPLTGGWKSRLEQFDIWGTLIFLPMIVCLLLALQWGGTKYPWKNGRIIALLVLFVVLLIPFIAIQFWKQDNATVPPRVLKQRSVASAAWFAGCLGATFFIFVYYLPIWFQAIKGVSAVQSGIRNIPMVLSLVLVSMVCGATVTKIGYYTPFIIASTVLMSVGAGLLSALKVHSGAGEWIGYQIVFGAGVGFGMQNTLIAVQTALPPKDIPIGTAIIMFTQTLGGALFVSVAQNVFTNTLLKNVLHALPNVNPNLILSTGATALKDVLPKAVMPQVLIAYNDALMKTFYVGVAMAAFSVLGSGFLEWKSVKGKKIEMAAA
ncbi:MFS general substrate transporter [Piedraia hortae CBS 480.64]|uniref:MFS general substrate transporter n=1 Tax=Piedraia hortae CBS 480.64 TaxID=1314780 RepID=A0A6A7C7Z8_9PEZI|nr:MFS general substrate transporter [Piedraia hortae CBS 480.64]